MYKCLEICVFSCIFGYDVRRNRQCISTSSFSSWCCCGENLFPEWIASC